MQATPLVVIAMGLDALPVIGRVMALALLMSCALYGFFKVLQGDSGGTLKLLYCKGALAALLVVPILVYLFDLRLSMLAPVPEL